MSMYQSGIPTGTVDLDQDYQNLQNNFQQLDTTFGVGHTLFSDQTAQNGYHKNIQMIPNSTTISNAPNNEPPTQPATIAGYGQLWSAQINDTIGTDEALFYLTGGGKSIQLTRNVLPVAASTGLSFIPGPSSGGMGAFGALIVQWGVYNAPNGNGGSVTFATPFPNNCFNVQLTMNRGSSTASVNYGIFLNGTPSKTGFNTNNGLGAHDVYWLAIGN